MTRKYVKGVALHLGAHRQCLIWAPVRPAVFRILRVFRRVLMIWRVVFFQLGR